MRSPQVGDRVRLIRPVDIDGVSGPAVGVTGVVLSLEREPSAETVALWRVQFDDFRGQLDPAWPAGVWIVGSDEVNVIPVP